jgi:AraC family transcriptional regulator, carnitine catabolism transcriptional activator
MKAQNSMDLPEHVGILLLSGFSMLSFCGLLEPLRLANQLLGNRHYSWQLYTGDGSPAQASCGLRIPADAKPDASIVPSCLFVVAGFDPWPQADPHLKNWLRALDRHGSVLGAVDTGSFLLASAGLIDNVATSLHWESAAAFQELFPNVRLSERSFIIEGRRLLCAGGAAVLEMMLRLIENRHGRPLGDAIAERLLFRRDETCSAVQRPEPERRLHVPDRDVIRTIAFMEQHIERRFSVAEISDSLGIPKRTLERKFQLALGQSPSGYYQSLRLDRARSLLRHCDLTVQEIAIASGFSSMSHFCRTYKARFAVSAGKDRRLDYKLVE